MCFACGQAVCCQRQDQQRCGQSGPQAWGEVSFLVSHGESLVKEWQSIAQPALGVGNMGLRVL